jgi:hypothetical protein
MLGASTMPPHLSKQYPGFGCEKIRITVADPFHNNSYCQDFQGEYGYERDYNAHPAYAKHGIKGTGWLFFRGNGWILVGRSKQSKTTFDQLPAAFVSSLAATPDQTSGWMMRNSSDSPFSSAPGLEVSCVTRAHIFSGLPAALGAGLSPVYPNPCSFPLDMSYKWCDGLNPVLADTSEACSHACCGDETCLVWQFWENKTDTKCWLGTPDSPCENKTDYVVLSRGRTFVPNRGIVMMKDAKQWHVDIGSGMVHTMLPRPLAVVGLPPALDAAVTDPVHTLNRSWFFSGVDVWRVTNGVVDKTFPQAYGTVRLWEGLPPNLDAAVADPENTSRTYFFKGDSTWLATADDGVTAGFPKVFGRDLWAGVPSHLDAAITLHAIETSNRTQTAFFKGDTVTVIQGLARDGHVMVPTKKYTLPCPHNCSGHGDCSSQISGECECDEGGGYVGAGCELKCPDAHGLPCSGHGHCIALQSTALCMCDDKYVGVACAQIQPPLQDCDAIVDTSGNGNCTAMAPCLAAMPASCSQITIRLMHGILAGTQNSNITVGGPDSSVRTLSVVGPPPGGDTTLKATIDGRSMARIFTVLGSGELVLRDLTITGGHSDASVGAGALHISGQDTVVSATRVTFHQNGGRTGGAVSSLDASPHFVDCVFSNNDATYGGGAFIKSSRLMTLAASLDEASGTLVLLELHDDVTNASSSGSKFVGWDKGTHPPLEANGTAAATWLSAGFSFMEASPFRLWRSSSGGGGGDEGAYTLQSAVASSPDATVNYNHFVANSNTGWISNSAVASASAMELTFLPVLGGAYRMHSKTDGSVIEHCVTGCADGKWGRAWLRIRPANVPSSSTTSASTNTTDAKRDQAADRKYAPLEVRLTPLRVATPTFTGCLFVGNHASNNDLGGGGVNMQNTNATFHRCIWRDNVSPVGGGVVIGISIPGTIDLVSPKFTECEFVGNFAHDPVSFHGDAGGVGLYTHGSPIFSHCIFRANRAGGWGGGVRLDHVQPWYTPTFVDCVFEENEAAVGLGTSTISVGGGAGGVYVERSTGYFER